MSEAKHTKRPGQEDVALKAAQPGPMPTDTAESSTADSGPIDNKEGPLLECPLPPATPKDVLPGNRKASWVFAILTVIFLVVIIVQPFVLQYINRINAEQKIVILDASGVVTVAPAVNFAEADKLHEFCAELATGALLQRNPLGPDSPGLLKQMFLEDAYEKAKVLIQKEADAFSRHNVHQKCEISDFHILERSETDTMIVIEGQLPRMCKFQGTVYTDPKGFRLTLAMMRNPGMSVRNKMPEAVKDIVEFKQWDLVRTNSDTVIEADATKRNAPAKEGSTAESEGSEDQKAVEPNEEVKGIENE